MSIASKLEYLDGTKDYIRQCIQQKGVTVPAGTTFRQYGDKILEIETEQHPPGWEGEGGGDDDKDVKLTTGIATATGQDFVLTPPEEYDGFSSVAVTGDVNLKPENIAEGITIYGVTGTMKLSTNTSSIPSQYLEFFDIARTYYDGDYKELMILESDEAIAFGFLLDGYRVESYDSSNTEFTMSNWVYVAYNKRTRTWKVEDWHGSTSNGNSYIHNIRYCSTYLYWGAMLIYPFTSLRPGGSSNTFSMIITILPGNTSKEANCSCTGEGDITVEWGDGTSPTTISHVSGDYNFNHKYNENGDYVVTITGVIYSMFNGSSVYKLSRIAKQYLTPFPSTLDVFPNSTSLVPSNGEIDFSTLPSYLFQEAITACDNTYSFDHLFSSSFTLKVVEDNVFLTFTNVINANNVFYGCGSLAKIPSDLFLSFDKMTTINEGFANTSLQVIPDGLFNKCISLQSAKSLFYGVTSLTSIPNDLFANCNQLIDLSECFKGCSGIKNLPDNLFPNAPIGDSVINCQEMFNGCTSLLSIPPNFFKNFKNPGRLYRMFRGCSNIVSEIPPIWDEDQYGETFSSVYHSEMFAGCIRALNYAQIPSGWK